MKLSRKLNGADYLLFLLFTSFIIALLLHLANPQLLLWDFLLFVIEAALVGGIADWFAVTALFDKPLGFGWHTNLLAKKRASFNQSTYNFIKREFISSRKLYRHIESLHLDERCLNYLFNNQAQVAQGMTLLLRKYVQNIDTTQLAHRLMSTLQNYTKDKLTGQMSSLHFHDKLVDFGVRKIIKHLHLYMQTPQSMQMIEGVLDKYQQSYAQSGLSGLMLSLALATNTLDPEELAQIVHRRLGLITQEACERIGADKELLGWSEPDELVEKIVTTNTADLLPMTTSMSSTALADELSDSYLSEDVEVHSGEDKLEDILSLVLEHLLNTEEFATTWHSLVQALAQSPQIEATVAEILQKIQAKIILWNKDDELIVELEQCTMEMAQALANSLKQSTPFRQAIARLCNDLAQRSALIGENVILDSIREYMAGLSDEDLENIIYPKVERDLIWIRFNGSILGSFIGMLIYGLLYLFKI